MTTADTDTTPAVAKPRTPRRLRVIAAALLFIFSAFGLLSYFWLPGYAKAQLEQALAARLHRPVSIQSIKIQPYALAMTVRGLRVDQNTTATDAPPLLAFDELFINLSTASLRQRAPIITQLRLKAPSLHIERGHDGRYSISDLLDEWLSAPAADSASPPAQFSVANLQIEEGQIDFIDHPRGSRQEVRDIQLGIPFIANLASTEPVWVDPYFSALINGAEFSLSGLLKPFGDKREASLELTLKDFDLTRIDEYSPVPLAVRIASARLDSDLNLVFSQTSGQPPEMSLSGDLALRQLDIIEADGHVKSAHHLLKLPELSVTIAKADIQGGLVIERAHFDAPEIQVRRNRDGRIDWLSMVKPSPAPATAIPSAQPALRIHQMSLSKGKLSFQDEKIHAPVVLDELDIRLKNLDSVSAAPVDFSFLGRLNRRGHLQASGQLGWAPTQADLQLELRDIDLVSLQAWFADRFNATLTHGAASFQGSLKAAGEPLKLVLAGEGRLSNFSISDVNASELLRWNSLDLGDVKLSTDPLAIDLGAIAVSNFFARVVISPEGQLNLKSLLKQDEAASTSIPDPSTSTPSDNPLRLGRITLQGGRINFSDNFIKPNYSANLTELGGRIGPLNTAEAGDIEIRGTVDRSAPLQILGKLSPPGKELAFDISAKAKGIDLPAFSPYSGKYVGYSIEKGKLSVDVKYRVENGELTAENSIFLDQLSFGEKIESPDALSLPVNLAVALLKNSRGEIDLNLPISGSLSDPQFSIGSLIGKVLINLVVKAVAAPFALLGSLFGGSDGELSQIDFPAGRATLSAEAETRLEALGKALTERPGLRLEITGRADPENDREGLKRAVLERKVRARKLAEQGLAGETGAARRSVQVNPDEYPKYLELAYQDEKFPKPKNLIGMIKTLPVPEMEQLMLANIDAGEDEMRQLADRRARAAREALVSKGGIAVERLFVLAPNVESEANGQRVGSRVVFSLK